MEESKTPEGETKSCCSTKKCCGCKAVGALLLLLIGGAGGWALSRRCGKTCAAPAQQAAPATPSVPQR